MHPLIAHITVVDIGVVAGVFLVGAVTGALLVGRHLLRRSRPGDG